MNYGIGKYEEVSLQSVINNAYEYFIPLANVAMSKEELIRNREAFQTQINAWIDQLSSSTNATEISNISKIIEIQSERLAQYDVMIAQLSGDGDDIPADPTDPAVPATTKKTNWGIIMLLAGVAIIYFLNRKNKTA